MNTDAKAINSTWESVKLGCPWREQENFPGGIWFSCAAVRYGNGSGRRCSEDICAPLHFIMFNMTQ